MSGHIYWAKKTLYHHYLLQKICVELALAPFIDIKINIILDIFVYVFICISIYLYFDYKDCVLDEDKIQQLCYPEAKCSVV